MNNGGVAVVKLGGSLLELSDLAARFEAFRAAELPSRSLLVVGGGQAADTVRMFDRYHQLGDETSHWLAVRAMQFNAHLLSKVLRRVALADDHHACQSIWQAGQLAIMEPLTWLEYEQRRGRGVPHHWQFTSDSIAAHAAARLSADELLLLKSALPQSTDTLLGAMEQGIVDQSFPTLAKALPSVQLVNLRDPAHPRLKLRSHV